MIIGELLKSGLKVEFADIYEPPGNKPYVPLWLRAEKHIGRFHCPCGRIVGIVATVFGIAYVKHKGTAKGNNRKRCHYSGCMPQTHFQKWKAKS